MNSRLTAIFEQSDGSQWLFASGLVLGFAGNLVIWALAPVPLQSNWKRLLISGGCFAVAGAFFSVQGWMLRQLEYIARTQNDPPRRIYTEIKSRLVSASLGRLNIVALLGIGFTVAGFVCIALGIKTQP